MKLFQAKAKIPQDFENETKDKTLFNGNITFENVYFKYPVAKDLLA